MNVKEIDLFFNKYMGDNSNKLPTIENMWDHIKVGSPDECWPSIKHLNARGHLIVNFNEKAWISHTLIYFQNYGPWDLKYKVRHWCDNVSCNNPTHLFIDTPENLKKRVILKFHKKKIVDSNPPYCWRYTGVIDKGGYGKIWNGEKRVWAHRFAWEIVNGPIPDDKDVLHICDNPPCVWVEHLKLGTHHENMIDCQLKGRSGKRTKLKPQDVLDILRDIEEGIPRKEISKNYGVGQPTISSIVHKKIWKYIEDPKHIFNQ